MTTSGKHGTRSAGESSARSTTTQQLLESSYQKVLNKYHSFLNEQVITVDDLAFVKDPNVRKSILAKIERESTGKNVGEYSYRNTSNDRIREKLPQLKKYSDAELNALKQDDRKFFDVAYASGGGYQYRGRGPIQITGKAQYAQIDKDLGLKGALVKDPDMLLRDPNLAKQASLQYLKNAGLDRYQAKDQTDAAQRVIQAIGGKAYRPGTKLGNSELSAVMQKIPTVGTGATTVAQTTTTSSPTPPVTSVKPAADVAAVAPTAPTTTTKPPGADVAAAAMPTKPMPGVDKIASADQPLATARLLPATKPGVNFQEVFDIKSFLKATPDQQADMTKFIKPTQAGLEYKKSLGERYEQFKQQTK